MNRDETTELRTTNFYTTCRICKRTVASQMMNAIFQRKDESESWVLAAWEYLPCTRYGYPAELLRHNAEGDQ